MQEKITKIKTLLKEKKYLAVLGVVVFGILFAFFGGSNNQNITIINPTFGTLKETVSATGVVTSKVDLDLSFKKSGTVKSVFYEVGDKVKEGQILATLSSGSEGADVARARAGVALAQAKLQKIKEGATSEEITLAKVSLNNAKNDLNSIKNREDTFVKNTYSKLLNSSLEASSENVNDNRVYPTISGTYSLGKEGSIVVSVYNTGAGITFSTSGLITSTGFVNASNAQPIGNSGLYILFPSTSNISPSNFIIDIPNKKASDYLANENAYNSAVQNRASILSSAESLVAQREAELALKQAAARPADLSLGEAEVLSARASLAQASANFEDTIIRAPKSGTVTEVNIKYGEIVDTTKPAIVVEDIGNLYVEAPINESNIKNIVINQPVAITFDALGDDIKFNGVVSHIDPSALSNDGVVNYNIKVSIDTKDPNVRPGMNADIVITTNSKKDVISLPEATVTEEEGSFYVNKITNPKKQKYEKVKIEKGIVGDGNMVEIISGINKEDSIALIEEK